MISLGCIQHRFVLCARHETTMEGSTSHWRAWYYFVVVGIYCDCLGFLFSTSGIASTMRMLAFASDNFWLCRCRSAIRLVNNAARRAWHISAHMSDHRSCEHRIASSRTTQSLQPQLILPRLAPSRPKNQPSESTSAYVTYLGFATWFGRESLRIAGASAHFEDT